MPLFHLFEIFAFVFGACIGSFLNVCIYRIPEGKSIVYPPSACPQCGYVLRFYDNIPIISYILLRARCRRCYIDTFCMTQFAIIFVLPIFWRISRRPASWGTSDLRIGVADRCTGFAQLPL